MLIFAIMGFLGCLLLGMALRMIILGYQSKQWQPCEGEIVNMHHVIEKGDTARRQRFNHLMVIYKYIINGKEYTNTRVRFKWTRQNIEEEKKRYSEVKIVKVYVNPENPNQAVLEPGVDLSNYTAIFAGVFFIVSGIALAIYV